MRHIVVCPQDSHQNKPLIPTCLQASTCCSWCKWLSAVPLRSLRNQSFSVKVTISPGGQACSTLLFRMFSALPQANSKSNAAKERTRRSPLRAFSYVPSRPSFCLNIAISSFLVLHTLLINITESELDFCWPPVATVSTDKTCPTPCYKKRCDFYPSSRTPIRTSTQRKSSNNRLQARARYLKTTYPVNVTE